jgi:hypothetical protein
MSLLFLPQARSTFCKHHALRKLRDGHKHITKVLESLSLWAARLYRGRPHPQPFLSVAGCARGPDLLPSVLALCWSFREHHLAEARLPRITLLSSRVNRASWHAPALLGAIMAVADKGTSGGKRVRGGENHGHTEGPARHRGRETPRDRLPTRTTVVCSPTMWAITWLPS